MIFGSALFSYSIHGTQRPTFCGGSSRRDVACCRGHRVKSDFGPAGQKRNSDGPIESVGLNRTCSESLGALDADKSAINVRRVWREQDDGLIEPIGTALDAPPNFENMLCRLEATDYLPYAQSGNFRSSRSHDFVVELRRLAVDQQHEVVSAMCGRDVLRVVWSLSSARCFTAESTF